MKGYVMDTSYRPLKDYREWKSRLEQWKLLKPLAREMRHNPTPAEKLLWQYIRDRRLSGVKFRRQHAIGPFIVDFYSNEAQLVIEVDGAVHDYAVEEDTIRQNCIECLGLRVIRFKNEEVLGDIDQVTTQIKAYLISPSPISERGPGGEVTGT